MAKNEKELYSDEELLEFFNTGYAEGVKDTIKYCRALPQQLIAVNDVKDFIEKKKRDKGNE